MTGSILAGIQGVGVPGLPSTYSFSCFLSPVSSLLGAQHTSQRHLPIPSRPTAAVVEAPALLLSCPQERMGYLGLLSAAGSQGQMHLA